MNKIENKWWFPALVAGLAVFSTIWLTWALGLRDPLQPLNFPRVILFVISYYGFHRLYSHVIRAAVVWLSPGAAAAKDFDS